MELIYGLALLVDVLAGVVRTWWVIEWLFFSGEGEVATIEVCEED